MNATLFYVTRKGAHHMLRGEYFTLAEKMMRLPCGPARLEFDGEIVGSVDTHPNYDDQRVKWLRWYDNAPWAPHGASAGVTDTDETVS